MTELVSVIIPTHNRAGYLSGAVGSPRVFGVMRPNQEPFTKAKSHHHTAEKAERPEPGLHT